MPNRFLVCSSDFATLCLASCFFRYSDFTAQYLGNELAFLNGATRCAIRARRTPHQRQASCSIVRRLTVLLFVA